MLRRWVDRGHAVKVRPGAVDDRRQSDATIGGHIGGNMRTDASQENRDTGTIQPTGRPVLSLLLFIHLFFVTIALAGNHFPSALEGRLVGLFSPYLRTLNFDLNFTPYYLTLGTVDDQDHRIEVLPAGEDPANNAQWVRVSDTHWRGGERYHRYQRLAASMAFFGERQQDNLCALFARSVAENFLNQRHIEPRQVRCRRILPQDRSAVTGGTPEQRDPLSDAYFAEVYRANAIVDGSTVSVVKVEDAGQVARPDAGGPSR